MTTAEDSRLNVELVEGVTVVSFSDRSLIAEDVIARVEEQLLRLIDQLGPGRILLSFRDVHTMSSAVLGVLLKLSRKVGQMGGRLRLCCVEKGLREAFLACGLDRNFEIHEHEATALDGF
jgi:anti-anti-sigma factor